MKRRLLFLGVAAALIVVLIALAGCQLLPTAQVGSLRMIARGRTFGASLALRPTEKEGGVAVTFVIDGATRDCDINYGDGQTGVLDRGRGTHLYTQGGTYHVRVISQGQVRAGTVTVLNHAPQVYEGASTPGTCGWQEKKVIDMRYREQGCHNGAPLSVSGARDIDGDELEYTLKVTGPDAHGNTVEYSVFNLDREKVNGEWTKGGLLVVFIGWTGDVPPYPFFVNPQEIGTKSVLIKCGPTPKPDPPETKVLGTATFEYSARDQWGGIGSASWTEKVTSSSCTGN